MTVPIRISDEERELVSLARNGDERGFAGPVRLHQRRAYTVARSIVLTHEDAEDAVQEGFLRAYQAIGRFDPGQPFGAWLNRIVANAALDIARRQKVRTAEELSDAMPSPFRNPGEDAELRARFEDALAEFPERARAVIVLHDVGASPTRRSENCWVSPAAPLDRICTTRDSVCSGNCSET